MNLRSGTISDADARTLLNATVVVSGLSGAMFLVWGLALYQYGDAYAQGHVVFYMVITVIGSIFCLMHSRSAALVLTGVTVIPFSVFFLATGHAVFIAIAINTLLVSIVVVFVLLTYSRDFADMIGFQDQLSETHRLETERMRRAAESERAAQLELLKHAGRFEAALNNMLQGLLHVRRRRSPDRLQPALREHVRVAGRADAAGRQMAGHCRASRAKRSATATSALTIFSRSTAPSI